MKSGEDKRCDKGENSSFTTTQTTSSDIRHTAMGVMALLRHDKKKALNQVKQLVKMNKDLAYTVLTSEVDGWTPVHACALRGTKKLLKTMLQAGISINITMGQPDGLPGGCTLLHVAANRADKKILDYLIHHGADVNARDSEGNTALFYARQSNKDNARLLMNCGATSDESSGSNHHSDPHHRNKLICETTLQRHSSLSHLPQEQLLQSTSADTSRKYKQPVRKHGSTSFTKSTEFDTTRTTSSGNSQFLTVPPTKFYSSTPCLNVQATSTATSVKSMTSSNSSSDITKADVHSRSNAGVKHKCSNNNSTSITNLNRRGVKDEKRTDYASTESVKNKCRAPLVQNNSD